MVTPSTGGTMKEKSAAELAKMYRKIREAIKGKEDEIKKYKEQLAVVDNELQAICEAEGANSLSTPEGTVIRRIHSNYWTSDWEKMHLFIAENDALHLLEKRIHNTNMKEFLADNPDLCPMGLQANTKYIISVRKPTKK